MHVPTIMASDTHTHARIGTQRTKLIFIYVRAVRVFCVLGRVIWTDAHAGCHLSSLKSTRAHRTHTRT